MSEPSTHIIFDGDFIKADKPVVPADSRGIMYGDGCFETLRSYSGRFLHFEEHLERLHSAANYLGLCFPDFFKTDTCVEQIRKLLEQNELLDRDAVVRIQLWRKGGRGYTVDMPSETHFSVLVNRLPDPQKAVKLATVSTRRIPDKALTSAYKLSNNINYLKAAREAEEQGADDALMQTVDGAVSETTIANIFWFKDDIVYTPSEACDLLPGITRDIVIDLCENELGVEVRQGEYQLKNLFDAEAVVICNSVRELVEVEEIDDRKFTIHHPPVERLKTAFDDYRKHHW